MRVMQVAVHEIVNMVAVRHGFVTAAGSVDVACFMTVTVVFGGAGIRVGRTDGDTVFVHMLFVRVVQMAIVQVINVAVMFYGGMAAVRAVLVRVVSVVRQGAGISHAIAPCVFFDEGTA